MQCSLSALIGGSYLASIPLCTLFVFTFSSIVHHFVSCFHFLSVFVYFLASDKLSYKFISPFQEHTSLTFAATLVAGSTNAIIAYTDKEGFLART